MITEKQKLYNKLQALITKKMKELEDSIFWAKESRDNDTKSSAGDKYETGREMMQAEINKNENQIRKFKQQKSILNQLIFLDNYNKVELGSLVVTDKGNYFLSLALGKITISEIDYYSISLASPIGKLFYGKQRGQKVKFQNKEYLIKDIV